MAEINRMNKIDTKCSLATTTIETGKVHVDAERAKPSKEVKVGKGK